MDHAAVLQQAQVNVVVVIVTKKAIRLRSKTTTLYVLQPFKCTFLYGQCTAKRGKWETSRFMEDLQKP